MSAACPHCTKDLGSGFVTQEQLEERIKTAGKNAREDAAAARIELDSFKAKAAAHDGLAADKTRLEAENAKLKKGNERTSALLGKGITLPATIRGLSRAYEDYVAEGGTAEFGAWLDADARQDPFLAPHFVTAAPPAAVAPAATPAAGAAPAPAPAAPPAAAAAPPAPAPVALPASNVGAATPPTGQQGAMTAPQLAAYYQSPEYKNLDSAGKRAKMAELEVASQHRRPAA
jgi:hypothetical protein